MTHRNRSHCYFYVDMLYMPVVPTEVMIFHGHLPWHYLASEVQDGGSVGRSHCKHVVLYSLRLADCLVVLPWYGHGLIKGVLCVIGGMRVNGRHRHVSSWNNGYFSFLTIRYLLLQVVLRACTHCLFFWYPSAHFERFCSCFARWTGMASSAWSGDMHVNRGGERNI